MARGVECVSDVRTVPRSRHNPQFDRSALPQSLEYAGLEYVHIPPLGELRHTHPDSLNAGWQNLAGALNQTIRERYEMRG